MVIELGYKDLKQLKIHGRWQNNEYFAIWFFVLYSMILEINMIKHNTKLKMTTR